MNVAIRPAASRDASAIVSLSTELGYPSADDQLCVRLEWMLSNADHAVFVAELAGRVAGWIHVYAYRVLESEPRAEIGGLVTGVAFRRHGIGRQLVERAEKWARERGFGLMSLRSNASREDARLFYEGLGYHVAKTQFSFRKLL